MMIERSLLRVAGVVAVVTMLLAACSATPPDPLDVGSFLPPDSEAQDVPLVEVSTGEHLCLVEPEKAEEELSVVGQVFEMSWENLWPGEYVPNVGITIKDWCDEPVHDFQVGPIGSFAFHLPVGEHGFDGYFEYPHRPDSIPEEEWTYDDYPLYREFDKPFRGKFIHCNLRLFAPDIIAMPLAMTNQQEDKGYIQGTLYDLVTYDTIGGAVITPSSGTVTYISDAHLPDSTLPTTQSMGLFLVANTEPGPVSLTVTLADGREIVRTVRTWPLNTLPNKVITNVGLAFPF